MVTTTFEEIVADGRGYVLGNELIFGAAPDYVGADMSPARVEWFTVDYATFHQQVLALGSRGRGHARRSARP